MDAPKLSMEGSEEDTNAASSAEVDVDKIISEAKVLGTSIDHVSTIMS